MRDDAVADAPGRVNLIGEHTDYHHGYVLPTIIPQRTRVVVQRRSDRIVQVCSEGMGSRSYELGGECSGQGWLDYVQGVTSLLSQRGMTLPGMNIEIASTVPLGAGVSSSAALEVALLRAVRSLLNLELDDRAIAAVAYAVETDFIGVPIGVMDQMAASLGREGEALFIDTRTLEIERIPIPAAIAIAVIDSGVPHSHAGGQYRVRREESFEAAHLLGVERLRDIDTSQMTRIAALPCVLAKRARHVVTENERVLAAVAALRDGDAARLGQLISASHASLRDDYEVSTPDVDMLVRVAEQHPAVYGARLTGGGFGGAIVAVTRAGLAADAAREVASRYADATGRRASVLVPP
jgi:galactokinase